VTLTDSDGQEELAELRHRLSILVGQELENPEIQQWARSARINVRDLATEAMREEGTFLRLTGVEVSAIRGAREAVNRHVAQQSRITFRTAMPKCTKTLAAAATVQFFVLVPGLSFLFALLLHFFGLTWAIVIAVLLGLSAISLESLLICRIARLTKLDDPVSPLAAFVALFLIIGFATGILLPTFQLASLVQSSGIAAVLRLYAAVICLPAVTVIYMRLALWPAHFPRSLRVYINTHTRLVLRQLGAVSPWELTIGALFSTLTELKREFLHHEVWSKRRATRQAELAATWHLELAELQAKLEEAFIKWSDATRERAIVPFLRLRTKEILAQNSAYWKGGSEKMLTPADVRNKQFNTTRLRPGYDEDEVDAFLDEVVLELDRLIRENEELRAQLAECLRGKASRYALTSPHAEAPPELIAPPLRSSAAAPPGGLASESRLSPSARHKSSSRQVDAVEEAWRQGRAFGTSVGRDKDDAWIRNVMARRPRIPSDLDVGLLQSSSLAVSSLLQGDIRDALHSGFWDALEALADALGQPASSQAVTEPSPGRSYRWASIPDAATEDEVQHADGVLRRFNFGPGNLVLVDQVQGNDTVNWSTYLTPRSFLRIAQEFVRTRSDATAQISIDGQLADMDASFLLTFAESASGDLDRSCDFVRFDTRDSSIAFQVLPQVSTLGNKLIGISADKLDVALLLSVMLRTASPLIVENALGLESNSFVSRITDLLQSQSSHETS